MTSPKEKQRESKKRRNQHTTGRIVKIFLIYFIVFVLVFAWIDYYTFEFFNPVPFVLFSLVVAAVAAFIHVRVGKKSEVDDLAEKL